MSDEQREIEWLRQRLEEAEAQLAQIGEAEEALRHVERLKALNEVLQYRARSLQDFLDRALDAVLGITQSQIGYIYFYDEAREEFVLNSWSKEVMKECAVVNPQTCYALASTGIWGEAVRQRRPILVNDFQGEHALKRGYPEGHVHLRRFLTVPITYEGRIVAVVGVANKEAPYDETDVLEMTLIMDSVWQMAERMRAEGALVESSRRLFEAIRAAQVGLWEWEVDAGRVQFSSEWKRQIGYAEHEIEDSIEEWERRVHPDDLDSVRARIQQALDAGEESYSVEFRFRHRDGSYRWILAQASIYRDEAGRRPRVMGSHIDITEQRRQGERIALLGRMLDEAPASITIHDAEGRFLLANQATFAQHGYADPDEFMALGLRAVDVPESEALISERMRLIDARGEARFEVAHYRRDGSIFPLDVLVRKIHWDGQPAMLSVATDITERRLAEQERERLNAQLIQAQKMESVGRLAGGVAHDFNNMLNVILLRVELALENQDLSPAQREDLREIQIAASHSAELTRQLLAFARKQTIAPRLLDLNDAVRSSLRMLERIIGEHITLRWEPGGPLPPVRIDPVQVEQLLTNLCVNARDAIGPRPGAVTIRTAQATVDPTRAVRSGGEPAHPYLVLSVTDDGCGMDEETRGHAFEPFFTTKGVGEGTGLGLATVFGIATQNGGFVEVDSALGEGATFRVYLPPAEERRRTGERPAVTSEVPAAGRETILLVEDEPAVLRVGKKLLLLLGYDVLAASSPGAALRLAKQHAGPIHLLITDVVMPEMNGRDLASALLHLFPDLRCLFMSGYPADVIAQQGVLDQGVCFMQKPFTRQILAAKVREALDDAEG